MKRRFNWAKALNNWAATAEARFAALKAGIVTDEEKKLDVKEAERRVDMVLSVKRAVLAMVESGANMDDACDFLIKSVGVLLGYRLATGHDEFCDDCVGRTLEAVGDNVIQGFEAGLEKKH